jgi:hypothetical protein
VIHQHAEHEKVMRRHIDSQSMDVNIVTARRRTKSGLSDLDMEGIEYMWIVFWRPERCISRDMAIAAPHRGPDGAHRGYGACGGIRVVVRRCAGLASISPP